MTGTLIFYCLMRPLLSILNCIFESICRLMRPPSVALLVQVHNFKTRLNVLLMVKIEELKILR